MKTIVENAALRIACGATRDRRRIGYFEHRRAMLLSRFPRVRLCHRPTPLEPMENLTRLLGGPRLLVKRDDCTGLATGGSKTRKLEFLMADALRHGADTIISHGAVQSNHARQLAAACCKLGLACELLLEHRIADPDHEYLVNGNVLLDRLFGAALHERPAGSDMNAAMAEQAAIVKARGGRPYVIPGGGSNPIGALGYVDCALELVQQANDAGTRIDQIVHATGSTGTQAGLIVGLAGANSGVSVLGISVRQAKAPQEAAVARLTDATAELLGIRGGIPREAVRVDADYTGEGYGVVTPAIVEAVRLVARHEGIVLDPVYSGKAMAGLLALVRKGAFRKDETIVFIHTGGAAGLFAYRSAFGFN